MVRVFQFRQNTAAGAASNNAVLAQGEPGYETDTGKYKIGDGLTPWADLGYSGGSSYVDDIDQLTSKTTGVPVTSPDGFSYTTSQISGLIYTDGKGIFKVNYDVSSLQVTGKTYYVSKAGSDSADGLSWTTAFATPEHAILTGDADVIYISAGEYYLGELAAHDYDIVRSVSIIGKSGDIVIFSGTTELSWTKTVGQTNVYQADRSAVLRAFDRSIEDTYGDYTELTNVVGISECDALAGSWYTDGSILYVHAVDSRAADSDIWAPISVTPFSTSGVVGGMTIYLENIIFQGGSRAIYINANLGAINLYVNNCIFRYSGNNDGFGVRGATCLLQNCTAYKNYLDGFNYHESILGVPYAVEVDCIGRDNGFDDSMANNGSTIHDGGSIIRVNTVAYRNQGPNIADTGTDTESWNLGCVAFESTADDSHATYGDKMIADYWAVAGAVKMWLDHCNGYGSLYSAYGLLSSTISIRSCALDAELYEGTQVFY